MAVIIFAVQQHFQSTLRSYNQPDTFNLETVFLRPSAAGKAVVVIKDVKLGVEISTVHFTLIQDDQDRVVGYATYVSSRPPIC